MDDAAFVNSDFHRMVVTAANRGRSQPHSMENVLRARKEGGVDATVISSPRHVLRDLDADQQLDVVKRHNRYTAAQQEKYDFIYGFAATVIFGGHRFLREFERAVKEDGLKGAWIMSN